MMSPRKKMSEVERLIRELGGTDYDVERLGYLRAPSSLRKDKPVFTVKIKLNPQFGTLVQKLERGEGSYSAPPGTYLCFPAWDWKTDLLPKEDEVVEVPRALIERVLESYRTRTIHDDLEEQLRTLLSKK